MKKTLLTITTILCISIGSFSQSEFGVLAGEGASTLYMTNYAEYLSQARGTKAFTFLPTGARQVGFYYNHSLTQQFGVGAELLLKSMGARYITELFSNWVGNSTWHASVNPVYLSVPLYARYTRLGGDFYLAAGVANNFFVHMPYPFWDRKRFHIMDNDVEINRYDLMAQFTFGGRLLPRLFVECTLKHSITRLDKNQILYVSLHDEYDYKIFNRAIYISLKYPLLSW